MLPFNKPVHAPHGGGHGEHCYAGLSRGFATRLQNSLPRKHERGWTQDHDILTVLDGESMQAALRVRGCMLSNLGLSLPRGYATCAGLSVCLGPGGGTGYLIPNTRK